MEINAPSRRQTGRKIKMMKLIGLFSKKAQQGCCYLPPLNDTLTLGTQPKIQAYPIH